MSLKEKQASEYMEEAELSALAARAIFEEARRTKRKLWAQVVKNAYDAMEQAVSAALATKNIRIPKDHPEKISNFINAYDIKGSLASKLLGWLGRRASSQYVDIKAEKIRVPHEIFDEEDAKNALRDCDFVIKEIKKLLKSFKS